MTVADIDKFTPVELDRGELEDLGIDVPRQFVDAFLNDHRTITVRVYDEDPAQNWQDCPRDDNSGDDAWEWIEFDSGRERDEWLEANFCCQECGAQWGNEDEACPSGYEESDKHIYPDAFRPGLDFWIERYEHGLVRYAPTGESSRVDRQWDVAPGVALMRFTKPETIGPDDDPDKLLNFARAVCDEYTAWCNGDFYGMLRYELQTTHTPTPFLEPADFTEAWVETDSCWGFLGSDYAEETAKTGAW